MHYFLSRIWIVGAFFIAIAIGSFLAESAGLGNDWGYGIGCVLGVVIWALGSSLLSTSIGPEKAEKKYVDALKSAAEQLEYHEPQPRRKQTRKAIKKCPYCAERIKADAIVCRYCGRDLPKPSS